MFELQNKNVLVIGLATPGQAACELLCHQGAKVFAVDTVDTADRLESAAKLRALGVEVVSEPTRLPPSGFDLAVVSSPFTLRTSLLQALLQTGAPVISELELGSQQTNCLSIALGGTNGKAT